MLPEDIQAALHELSSLAGRDYVDRPLPSDADERVSALVTRFAAADEVLREAVRHALTREHEQLLSAYGIRMAMLAVREQSVERLRLGLVAVALASGSPGADWRDLVTNFPPLEDAARRVSGDAGSAFAEAARLARAPIAGLIWGASPRRWFLRLLRRLRFVRPASTWKASDAPDGFRYVVENLVTEADLMQRVTSEQIKGLSAALESYRHDNGRYPTTGEGLAALWTAPTTEPRPSNWKGPYWRQRAARDLWGRPFVYRCPGERNPAGYDLSSSSADEGKQAPGGS